MKKKHVLVSRLSVRTEEAAAAAASASAARTVSANSSIRQKKNWGMS